MVKWFKGLFEYKGSSMPFTHLHQYANDELDCEACNLSTVLDTIDMLIKYAKTEGDARLIRELQTRTRVRINPHE